ncbi:hypothetical protein LAZ67_2000691 [Cordylochernes scorpioides]|uniref:Uncharacterized protein n=1 Tax=Cordylochernes scorpioides TaxID=51811 RepID=A0ABY6K0Y5_9ARAC|nr:hypothetical protein LAZ67_2000691 [Cordylochernes scorpioides]
MSSTHRCAVRVPGRTTNGVLISNEMAPQTITPCCGPVWCSTVRPGSTRCPGRLQTRLRRSSGHNIAPNDFFLFPKLKAVLKGRHFDTRDDIIEKSPLALKSITKEAYKNCFDNWEKRWR